MPKPCVRKTLRTRKKIFVYEINAVDLSKIYFLKNAKKTFKPNNRDLNRNWKIKIIKNSVHKSQFYINRARK